MTSAPDTGASIPAVAGRRLFALWVPHLLSILIPSIGLTFLWTGPHSALAASVFLLPLIGLYWLERKLGDERRVPLTGTPAWPFDLLVYGLAGVQLYSIYALGVMYSTQSLWSLDLVMASLVLGSCSGFQIITAHELIHRRSSAERWLGRALLCMVLYEHFYTEHIRGHHVRVGTLDDPATARLGESFRTFYRRTVPAQFADAWRLECGRLGNPDMRWFDRRQLGNRVAHGVAVELGLLVGMASGFGATAAAAFVLQALSASHLLEAVNYFEHWGLMRRERRVGPSDSWDTHSRFTYFALIGLSRHADHHAFASRPYQQLRIWDAAPILPRGYIGMIFLTLFANRRFNRLMVAELERVGRLEPPTATELAADR